MNLKTVIELARNKQFFLLVKLTGLLNPFYKLSYLASLIDNGFIDFLADRPRKLEELAEIHGIAKEHHESLKAWLQVGIRLNEIGLHEEGYILKGLSGKLARAGNDALLAIVQEVASLHHKLILETPEKLKQGERWTLNDQDGEIIARSSRIVEPFQREVIDAIFPDTRPVRLLEVGCGSGIYIRHAAMRNPRLTAVGVELQSPVAEMARRNMEAWSLQDRVKIESGDIEDKVFESPFDIVTLYNNIYYFPVAERTGLLKHLWGFLEPGGTLVVTTACQGGQPMLQLLNLWGASTQGCDRLPYANEMIEQMEAAGFVDVRAKNLFPGDAFYMFAGMRSYI